MIFYSPANRGFYTDEIQHAIPSDAIPIDEDTHQYLLQGLQQGKTIITQGQRLILIDLCAMSETLQVQIADAVQEVLNKTAMQFGYDSIFTAVTYAEEPAIPKFQREGQALRAWRSRVWATCYSILEDVKAGKQYISMPQQVIA